MASETRQWAERFEALRDDLATGDLYYVQKWVQNDGALTEIAEGIARLTRELEDARELIRELVDDEDAGLVWLGKRLVCAYCTADGLYSVAHAADCPIIRARHAIAALRSEAQGEDRWEDLVFGPIVQAHNEAQAARRGEGGGDGD